MIARAPHPSAYSPTVTPLPKASRYITFHGKEILRVKGFMRGPLKQALIKCPNGHRVTADAYVREGALYCNAQLGRGQSECGALIYALAIPSYGNPAHRIFLADVTREELKLIDQLGLDADGVLAYFGQAFER